MMAQESFTLPALNKDDLQKILSEHLGKNLCVLSFVSKPANQKGENYGSTLLFLEIDVQISKGSPSETLHIIAKMAPPTSFLQGLFNFPVTFCKEMNVYKLVCPAFKQLFVNCNVPENTFLEFVPTYYGARTSLNGCNDTEANVNAILLLQNLISLGYKMCDRISGLNLEHCQLVIRKLAAFHAIPIAMRYNSLCTYNDTVLKAAYFCENPEFNADTREKIRSQFLQRLVCECPEILPYIKGVEKRSQECDVINPVSHKEPFCTFVHNDLWTNNMLFCYNNNTPIDIKFIDFQGTFISSPIRDLVFFLHTSAESSVLEKHYDQLIDLYYEHFSRQLQHLHFDINLVSRENFEKEKEENAPNEFFHIIFMLTVIYTEKGNVNELSEITSFDHLTSTNWSTLMKAKIMETVKHFEKYRWL